MSKGVCVLAHWEAHDYLTAEKRESRSYIAESSSDAVQLLLGRTKKEMKEEPPVKGKIRRVEYVTDYRLDCKNHKHIGLDEARQMVAGKRPVAKWVGPGEQRITGLAQPKFNDLSTRPGFDRQGCMVKSGGRTGLGETGEEAKAREIPNASRRKIDVMSIPVNGATDLIGVMLSESRRRLPSTSSRMRTGNSGGDGSFLERRKQCQ